MLIKELARIKPINLSKIAKTVIVTAVRNIFTSMLYLFLDESGDLGFNFRNKRTSKFFIVTILATTSKRSIEKLVSKTYLSIKRRKQKSGTLHAFRETPITRLRLLKGLADKDCTVMTLYLNKKRVYTKLTDEKVVLYNYLTNILLDRIMNKRLINTKVDSVTLIASQRETNKFLNENFKNYLCNQTNLKHKLNITVSIKTPYQEKCLQAVDFASWAIFRKHEYDDDSYYQLFKSIIVEENYLFG